MNNKYLWQVFIVIDLDDIWKWLDFQSKQKSKDLLEKNFTIDKDYKRLTNSQVKQTTQTRGGHNKETFMLKINTFKGFCLKAGGLIKNNL